MRIRRGLSSRHLPCGCVVGIYETYDDETVAIVDVHGNACHDPEHAAGNAVPVKPPSQNRAGTHDGTVR
jgi:hypothetical protein